MGHKSLFKKCMTFFVAGVLTAAFAATAFAATKTRLATVEDVYWDEDNVTLARWDEVEDANKYQVYLYRDESRVATVTPSRTYVNLKRYMTTPGDYYFKVRALAKNNSKEFYDGYWSDDSESFYVTEDRAELLKNGGVVDTEYSGPGAKEGGGNSTVTSSTSVVYSAGWNKDGNGWWYRNSDGSYPANGWWLQPDTSIWYFFNEQGYMQTGWIDWNGARYYCLPESGAMVTGDTTVDGVTYHFDGATGALIQ